MTTTNDNLKERLENAEWGYSIEYTLGVPFDGTVDPTGEYPKRSNFFSPSVSNAARGTVINSLWSRGSSFGINFELSPNNSSLFPFNQANETPSGHSFEIDDTPGNERILIKHRTGAGVELKTDGSVLIVSRGNKIDVVGSDYNMNVSGVTNLVYDGDLNTTVNGNYNLVVNGSYNTTVGSNKVLDIHGSNRVEVGDVFSEITRGNRDTRTYGETVEFLVNNKKTIAKKDVRTVVGNDFVVNSKRHARFTTQELFSVSAQQTVSLVGMDMRVSAPTGLIGGEKMHYVGELYTGPSESRGTNTFFYGHLIGRALESWTSKYSKFTEHAHSAYRSQWTVHANWALASKTTGALGFGGSYQNLSPGTTASPMTTKPDYQFDWGWSHKPFGGSDDVWSMLTDEGVNAAEYPSGSDWVEVWLKSSPFGVKKILIDENNFIENKISKIDNYSNYFNWDPSTFEIRAKLRTMDGAIDSKTSPEGQTDAVKCISALLKEGRLHALYKSPVPSKHYKVQRVANSLPKPKFGYTLLGNPPERSSKTFRPKVKPGSRLVLADPVYNPDTRIGPITSSTKVSKSCSIGNFFGAPGSRASIEFVHDRIKRQNLARQWCLHGMIVDGVNSSEEFKDYRLQITEGYYHPAIGIRELTPPPWPTTQTYDPTLSGNQSLGFKVADSLISEGKYWREPYKLLDSPGVQRSLVQNLSINELKKMGRAVVYTLYNSRGKVDYSKTFDLALYIRDNFHYEQLSLDYDMTRPDGIMSQQLLIIMPEIKTDWRANFAMKVCTYFNRSVLSGSDLVEIIEK